MRVNNKLLLLTIFLTFLGAVRGNAQESSSVVSDVKYGGITLNEKDQNILDHAKVVVTYRYSYAIRNNDGSESSVTDTLALAIGEKYSVYLDPMYRNLMESQRQGRISRAKRATGHEIVEDLSSVVELINSNSDYTEDDPGDPIQIFKNRDTGEISSIFNSYIANIRHDQKIEEMARWEITEETDTIMGYLCYKANVGYGGREYYAWFTLEIPINDGPWKLWGLPGLILKANDSEHLFEWEAIGVQNVDGDIIMDDEDYDKATLSQFHDYVGGATSSMIVEFFNQSTLYHSEKDRGYTRILHEITT